MGIGYNRKLSSIPLPMARTLSCLIPISAGHSASAPLIPPLRQLALVTRRAFGAPSPRDLPIPAPEERFTTHLNSRSLRSSRTAAEETSLQWSIHSELPPYRGRLELKCGLSI